MKTVSQKSSEFKKISKRLLLSAFSIVILLLCLLPSLYRVAYGAFVFDEPYQILNGLNYKCVPFSPLTGFFTGIIGPLIDWQWLSFRYIAIGINALCIVIGGFILFISTKKYWYSLIITSSCVLVGTIFPDVQNLYGWDRWTELFLMILIIIVFIYNKHQSIYLICLAGIISSFLILSRLPNICVILPISFYFWFKKGDLNISKAFRVAFYIVPLIISLFLLIVLLFGSIDGFFEAIKNNSVDKHGFIEVLSSIFYGFTISFPLVAFWGALYFLLNKVSYKVPKIIFLIIVLMSLWLSYYNVLSRHNSYYVGCLYYMASYAFFVISYIFYNNSNYLSSEKIKFLSIIIMIGFVPIIGSDTGFIKFLTFPLLPVIFIFMYPHILKIQKILYGIFIVSLLGYSYNGLRNSSFGDVGILGAVETLEYGTLKGIKTTKDKKNKLMSVYKNYSPYVNSKYSNLILRQGIDYTPEYMFLLRNDFLGSRFEYPNSSNSAEYVEWVGNKIKESNKPFAILYFISDLDREDENKSLMYKLLENNFEKTIEKDDFIIFVSKDEKNNEMIE